MKPMGEVLVDLNHIIKATDNKPFAFLEVGYSANPVNGGSLELQAEFVRKVFSTPDPYRKSGQLKFLEYLMIYDFPPELTTLYQQTLGIDTPGFVEYVSTLGLREYTNNGRPRPGWDIFVQFADAWISGKDITL